MATKGTDKRRAQKINNPLQASISAFVTKRHPEFFNRGLSPKDIPKRYSRYGSLLLLGPTFETHSPVWTEYFGSLTADDKSELFKGVVESFGDGELTHVAINAPILATANNPLGDVENVMRSPTGLQPVYNDFGPSVLERDERSVSQADFEAAYWTQTVQLKNLVQVWAPRWTMFSRGNISEKARILQGGLSNAPFPGLDQTELGEDLDQIDVVDFYVGIGYFAFPYLLRGVRRVWGWDINGWSVEGLRRGCLQNGWGVRIVKIDEHGHVSDQQLDALAADIQSREGTSDSVRCVVFWGDNRWARGILATISTRLDSQQTPAAMNVRHCNLGLLPTSSDSWEYAVQLLNASTGGWLHIHENAEVDGIDAKRESIVQDIDKLSRTHHKKSWSVVCPHVQEVKTYAPSVVHCVFDIQLYPSRQSS